MIYNKRGQVWVETVIYTLIAFVLIGTVLAIAQPRIEEIQDKAFVEQSLGVMKDINNILLSISYGGAGNKRLVELGIKQGSLKIDSAQNQLVFEMDSSYMYSEPGEDIFDGNILIHTRKKADIYTINMSQDYSDYNITYLGRDEAKIISKSSTPYQLFISHKGKDSLGKTLIDFEVA